MSAIAAVITQDDFIGDIYLLLSLDEIYSEKMSPGRNEEWG